MAEPLKNYYGPEIPKKIAEMISAVHPAFPTRKFLSDALAGYADLELMPRGRHIAKTLKLHLPADYEKAVGVLIESMGPAAEQTENRGLSPFLYMPHAFFVSDYGLNHFESSMRAQYEITQRFTAEFSIRNFLIHHQDKTLQRLKKWASDPSAHVRRLVSEGTRPRLPWAQRLPAFQKDPDPVLRLLELLKDDPSLYVRRSVANNLNDIGKDNPAALFETAARWMKNAGAERKWIVSHALRSAVKLGKQEALSILGFGGRVKPRLKKAAVIKNGEESVTVKFTVVNKGVKSGRFLVDFRIHYVKAGGRTAPKVFKLRSVELKPGAEFFFSKKVSLKEMTTRKHHPGLHKVDALVNGVIYPVGRFFIYRDNRRK